jgi:hypothetical protein
MVKNPFKQASDALDPKKKTQPKASTKKAEDLTKGGTSRQASIRAAERRRNAAKVGYQKSSTNKGKQ